MTGSRTYPHGVPCWIDTEQPDLDAAVAFYGGLFGWTFDDAMPPGAPGAYLIASLDGRDVAALAPPEFDVPTAWNTYVAVEDADASAAALTAAGGTVAAGPDDAGPGGRFALCADPGRCAVPALAGAPAARRAARQRPRHVELQRPAHARPRRRRRRSTRRCSAGRSRTSASRR